MNDHGEQRTKKRKKKLKLKKEKESKDKLCAIAIMLKWLNLQITKKKNQQRGMGYSSVSPCILLLFFFPHNWLKSRLIRLNL